MPTYAIGVDFGTESGRALIVDVTDGRELATALHAYKNGVIDEKLPNTTIRLEPDWALQDPNDYIEVLKHTVPRVIQESGVDPADVIGLGIDFTACTMLPTTRDGTPLCQVPEFRNQPHAWVKLWKHHAAQPEVLFNYTQYPMYDATLLVRTAGDPMQLAAAIRKEAATLNSRAVVTEVRTMEQIAADSIAQPRFRSRSRESLVLARTPVNQCTISTGAIGCPQAVDPL